jgi:hypothetical protein
MGCTGRGHHRCGPQHNGEAAEFATLEWVDWFNHRRLVNRLATFRRRSSNSHTIVGVRQRDSSTEIAGIPGAVHLVGENPVASSGKPVH